MWDEGIFVFNAHANEVFTFHAVLLYIVNDFQHTTTYQGIRTREESIINY